MWKQIRYESDTCICACSLSAQIGSSPVNATTMSLKSEVFFLKHFAVQTHWAKLRPKDVFLKTSLIFEVFADVEKTATEESE